MTRHTPHLTLVDLHPGEQARVAPPRSPSGHESRLASMGLHPGVMLNVLQHNAVGPLIVAIGETRLMLARELAHAVNVVRMPCRNSSPGRS